MPDLESTLAELTVADLQRINVVGLSGSGKSTIARRLGEVLQAEYVEMDRLFHGPNWTEATPEVFRGRITKAISGDRWVLDGNYHSKTYDLKWDRATSSVWVNTSFSRNIWQSTTRAIHRAWTQQELWPETGNRETFRKTFLSRQSIILWAFANYHNVQRRYQSIRDAETWQHIRFIELRTRNDAENLIARSRQLFQL